jgi:methylase of polypeptide subunit release factors
MEYLTATYRDITVCYTDELVGGGESFGQEYLTVVEDRIGHVDRVFEWCAGPGFIGFSLLAHGLCESLCLADVNPTAVEAYRETIRRNQLQDRVTVYQSDCLNDIPADESWDFVSGNPPHSGTDQQLPWGPDIIYMDAGWALHRRFYGDVARFLRADANILIQENRDLSKPEDFRPMIEESGLQFAASFDSAADSRIYYVWSKP